MDIKILEKKCKKKVVKKVIVDDKVDDEKEQTLPEKKVVVKKIPIDEKLFTEVEVDGKKKYQCVVCLNNMMRGSRKRHLKSCKDGGKRFKSKEDSK